MSESPTRQLADFAAGQFRSTLDPAIGAAARRSILDILGVSIAAVNESVVRIVANTVLGRGGISPPSDRIVMASIGVGWMGTSNLNGFLNEADTQVVAVCDIDKLHLAEAKRRVDEKYGNQDCATYDDFRECLHLPSEKARFGKNCCRPGRGHRGSRQVYWDGSSLLPHVRQLEIWIA